MHIQCINAGGNHIIEGSVNQIKLEITCKSNSTFPTQSFPAVVAAAEKLRIYFRLDLSEQRPAPNLPLPTLLYCFGQSVVLLIAVIVIIITPHHHHHPSASTAIPLYHALPSHSTAVSRAVPKKKFYSPIAASTFSGFHQQHRQMVCSKFV